MGEAIRCAAERDEGGQMLFHLDDGVRVRSVGELYSAALARGARLVDRGLLPGDVVGLVGPNEPAWIEWAYGIWLAGGALLPLPAPMRVRDRSGYAAQLHQLTTALGARFVVAHPRYAAAVGPDLLVPWEPHDGGSLGGPVEVSEDLPASITCTSGSTALPKGIVQRHTTAAPRLSIAGFMKQAGHPLLMPSLWWFPFFHSTGMGEIMGPLLGCEVHVLPPERFARDPALWLRLVGETQVYTTGAPSSGWAAALRAIERRPEGVDLSSLGYASFGLEMVDPEVLDRLTTIGGRHGLRPEAVGTAYGLSEAGGTNTPFGAGVLVDEIDLETLVMEGLAQRARPGRTSKRVASCGAPAPETGIELRVVGPDGPAPDRVVGEIQMRGNVMDGYLNNRGEDPFIEGGWLRTGDLGYLFDGELYVTGRVKEMVVHQGRNYYPQDIEWAVERRLGLDPGTCVAFAPVDGSEGDVVVALELPADGDEPNAAIPESIGGRVRAAVIDLVGLVPREVVLVAAGRLPRAANGKLQRLAAVAAHAEGELGSTAHG